MTDYAKYPYATLQSLGSNLTGISETVSSSSKGSYDVSGLSGDQGDISNALGDFRDEWEASVDKLGESIGGYGELTTQIGDMSQGLDQALADAMNPGATSA
ncbi:hypothetical protein GIS00_15045 [Nakamurella sp. YIM 132087]|uniref:Uncharacterized protein n=1 Tax=Nakamurella alba TaxID=2665158 RepID=A0A7K1FM75_9ACTN|nr:hypothetical protein [Nakamurella alba]MTD15257.1 hypothetical protein [Nakamurella alba]